MGILEFVSSSKCIYMVNGSNRLMPMGIYDEATISKVSTEIAEAFNKKISNESKTKCLFCSPHHILLLTKIFFFIGNTSLKFIV